jgi:signal peptidase I
MGEASALRGLDPVRIDRVITMRRSFRSIITWSSEKKQAITDEQVQDLHTFCTFLLQAADPYKLVLSGDRVWVYANSLEFLKSVTQSPGAIRPRYTRAVIDRPVDTIVLKNPQHAQRSYFKEQAVSPVQKEQLIAFFNNHMNLRASRRKKEIQAVTLEKWNIKRERRKVLESYLNTTFSEDLNRSANELKLIMNRTKRKL